LSTGDGLGVVDSGWLRCGWGAGLAAFGCGRCRGPRTWTEWEWSLLMIDLGVWLRNGVGTAGGSKIERAGK
jgi:hypothetical protein